MKYSRDYHDYVFKNGKFIGKFDEMYKYSKVIPWHQDKVAYYSIADHDIAILRRFKYNSICDVGCGLGYFSQRLYKELSSRNNKGPEVTGIDISITAVKTASGMFPHIKFIALDMTQAGTLPVNNFDLVVVKEIFWYILNKPDIFLTNASSLIKRGGFFYVSQSFPASKDWVGKKLIGSPQRIGEIISRYADLLYSSFTVYPECKNNPVAVFLGKKKN